MKMLDGHVTSEGVRFDAFLAVEHGMPRVGYRVTHVDGCIEYVSLLPSGSTGEGPDTSNVFLYHSDDDGDTLGDAVTHFAFEPHDTPETLKTMRISAEAEQLEPRPKWLQDTRTIYVYGPDGQCFVTPDGVGRYFYDSVEAAREDYE